MGNKNRRTDGHAAGRRADRAGRHGPLADDGELAHLADEIGYPLIVKAAAVGGGKGMKVVAGPDDVERAFESAPAKARATSGMPPSTRSAMSIRGTSRCRCSRTGTAT